MRELEGAGIVHRSDNDFNPQVVSAVKDAKLFDARTLIDYWRGGKTYQEAVRSSSIKEKETKDVKQNIEEEER